jgi:hypothetical protein
MSKLSEPLEPLISNCRPFLRPEAKRVASIVPDGAVREVDYGLDGVVDRDRDAFALLDERARGSADGRDLTDEVARQVDHVRARSPSAPEPATDLSSRQNHRKLGVDDPLLQVAAAEVEDLAQLAGRDDLAGQPDRGTKR